MWHYIYAKQVTYTLRAMQVALCGRVISQRTH
jgi:hypothetical protein